MRIPASVACVPFLAGCVAGLLIFDSPSAALPAAAAGAAALAAIAALAAWLDDIDGHTVAAIACGSAMAGLSLGASAARDLYEPALLAWFREAEPATPVEVEAVLREDAVATAFGASLLVDVRLVLDGSRRLAATGGARITVAGTRAASDLAGWRGGRTIRAPVAFRLPAVYRNPGVPDDRRALARRGIALAGTVKSAALVEIARRGGPAAELAASVRAWTRRVLAHRVGRFSQRSAAVATAILIGDRTGLPEDDERRLQEAGTYHVLAISGGNIAILTAIMLLGTRAVRTPDRAAAALTIVALVFYYQVAGHAASVGRAVAAAVIFLSGRLVDHRGAPLNALAVAAMIVVAAEPQAPLDPGFILSFGATLAILAGAPRLLGSTNRARTVPGRVFTGFVRLVRAMLVATVCAELALAPVSAALFSRVTFAGLLLNFAAIPLMTVVQLAALTVMLAEPLLAGVSSSAGRIAHISAARLVESARLMDHAPWLAVDVRPPGWPLVIAYYAGLLLLLAQRTRRTGVLLVALPGGLLLLAPAVTSRDHVPPSALPLRVVVLDVGQGDATLLQLPNGRAMLVDAGGLASGAIPDRGDVPPGTVDIGDRVVRPALVALGVTRLDALVLTHGDADHVQGARAVLRRLAARGVWEGVPVPPHAGLRAIAALVAAQGGVWRTVQAGDRERFGEIELRVLHPPLPGWERQRVRNEDSVVLEARIGAVSIVLPGDIGAEGEAALLPWLEPGRLVALKVPHHGSATSSTPALLDGLRPAAAIVSAGRRNPFGHPHPAVVERYRARGTALFSTAEDGAVFVETDGREIRVRGWTGREITIRHDGYEDPKANGSTGSKARRSAKPR